MARVTKGMFALLLCSFVLSQVAVSCARTGVTPLSRVATAGRPSCTVLRKPNSAHSTPTLSDLPSTYQTSLQAEYTDALSRTGPAASAVQNPLKGTDLEQAVETSCYAVQRLQVFTLLPVAQSSGDTVVKGLLVQWVRCCQALHQLQQELWQSQKSKHSDLLAGLLCGGQTGSMPPNSSQDSGLLGTASDQRHLLSALTPWYASAVLSVPPAWPGVDRPSSTRLDTGKPTAIRHSALLLSSTQYVYMMLRQSPSALVLWVYLLAWWAKHSRVYWGFRKTQHVCEHALSHSIRRTVLRYRARRQAAMLKKMMRSRLLQCCCNIKQAAGQG